MPGYGEAASLVAMARRALEEAPPRFSLVGHSMGGRVALEVYRFAPERVERIALLDTGVHPTAPGEASKRRALADLGRQEGMAALVDAWLPPMVHPARREEETLMEALRLMCIEAGLETYERQIDALIARPDPTSMLSSITCPALVATGRQDEWSPPEQHEEIAAAIADATLTIFEDCGHMSPAEAPEALNAALEEWLAR